MYRLIVVDDDSNEREGLKYLIALFDLPFMVTEASNGKDALAKFESADFACLITDIKMPVMNGLALCEEIQAKNPDMIKIIYSAHSDFEFTKKAIQIKVDDYILKPIIPDEFLRVMRGVAARLGKAESPQFTEDSSPDCNSDSEQDVLSETGNHKYVIKQITEYIDNNIQNHIGLDDIAHHVYLSPGYLSTFFKKETNKSIVQYITIRRMQKAKEMIMNSNISIKKIGQAVSYRNTSYFCLLFRKYYGITAQQMRERPVRDENA